LLRKGGLFLELWHVWVLIAVILFIAEIFTTGFLLAAFGMGCLASGLVSYFHLGFAGQTIAFIGATLAVFFGIRPFFLRFLHPSSPEVRTNTDALIGKTGRVSEDIVPSSNRGRVIVGGEDWKAVSVYGTVIRMDQNIVVTKVEGAKLFVKTVDEKGA
jgi:membrane protein implicated in regulation of membrane protease activity